MHRHAGRARQGTRRRRGPSAPGRLHTLAQGEVDSCATAVRSAPAVTGC